MTEHKWTGQDKKRGIDKVMRGALSVRAELCGCVDCLTPPEETCHSCKLWYCQGHFPAHFDFYPDHRSGRDLW